jgi:hypothetical protein
MALSGMLNRMGNAFFRPDTSFPSGSTVMQRLGMLCYWGGNTVAALTAAGTLALVMIERNDMTFWLVAGALVASGAWIAGRSALFLFANR